MIYGDSSWTEGTGECTRRNRGLGHGPPDVLGCKGCSEKAALNPSVAAAESATLKANTPTVAIPRPVYHKTTPTYIGRNMLSQFSKDADDQTGCQQSAASLEAMLVNRDNPRRFHRPAKRAVVHPEGHGWLLSQPVKTNAARIVGALVVAMGIICAVPAAGSEEMPSTISAGPSQAGQPLGNVTAGNGFLPATSGGRSVGSGTGNATTTGDESAQQSTSEFGIRDAASLGMGLLPVVGSVLSLVEFVTA